PPPARASGWRSFPPLAPRRFRRPLGIPRRLVELVRIISARRSLRRSLHRLSRLLLSIAHRMETLLCLAGIDRSHYLDQRARHPDGGPGRHRAGDLYFCAADRDGRDRPCPLAAQSVHAVRAAAPAAVQSLRRGTGVGPVALLRIRTA